MDVERQLFGRIKFLLCNIVDINYRVFVGVGQAVLVWIVDF